MAKKKSTIELTLLDRIIIPGILKQEGDYTSLIVMKDLKSKVQITQSDIKTYGIKTVGEGEKAQLTWNEKGVKARFQYEFTDLEKLELKLALTKINEDKKLNDSTIGLYEKFAK